MVQLHIGNAAATGISGAVDDFFCRLCAAWKAIHGEAICMEKVQLNVSCQYSLISGSWLQDGRKRKQAGRFQWLCSGLVCERETGYKNASAIFAPAGAFRSASAQSKFANRHLPARKM
jgi:hypothetical protein